jgi:molybdopterin/thiamine biosynthesis adenylyltransferase
MEKSKSTRRLIERKMNQKKNMRIRVVGAGGIGLCLLPPLCRFLSFGSGTFSFYNPEVWIADGDSYEPKNKSRQKFDRFGNKAESSATAFGKEFPQINVRPFPEYVTSENIESLIRENDFVFSCVDNHSTRLLLSNHCDKLRDVVLISGGNELTDGNVQVYIRQNGKDVTLPLDSKYHPEIANPPSGDENPGEIVGCAGLAPSAPQLLITNNFIAALMLNAFYAFLTQKMNYDEVFADIISNKVKSVQRTPNVKVEVIR